MLFELLAVLEERKINPFLFSSITAAELQQKLLHILAPRTQHRTELSSQSNRCSSDISSLKSPTLQVSLHALDILQHSVQTATRGAASLYFESQRKHAEEVDVQVKSSLKIVMSGFPCKIGYQFTAISKTFGDFSLVCGLQFVEQQFN